ncbi:GNAT family N-acetyltransferase [Actinoplanes sp. GCM10030250]|uniref:GNAT family N-acetyltransferase n=1 Tax=Actinoplanes sp. GCM10030250 TaxID=3273376 RepID=UPI003621F828
MAERRSALEVGAEKAGSPDAHGVASLGASPEVIMLRTGDQLEAAARLLWTVWEAGSDAERGEVISTSMLRTLAHSGNYVAGAYVDDQLIGCTVGVFGACDGKVDRLHSHITGVYQPGRNRGTGFVLKRHQRQWALDNGLDIVTWTFDPLVSRNGYFNLCKLGARVTEYRPDFYGRMDDGANTNDRTDRLLVEWPLRSEWVEEAMTGDPGLRRHAAVVPGAQVIAVPEDIRMLREAEPEQAKRMRFEVRDRFLSLFADGYQVVGMSKDREYVLLPSSMSAAYES